ncbi:MAG: hypothetical protein GF309_16835 [Candidatus Lokiarchaeota archaeon]|nr:hypothetical protein [Candidatus Lokiarchaeota archaeon]
MKTVQIEISDEERAILVSRAKQAGKSLEELLRSLIRSYLSSAKVNPNESFFDLKFEGKKGERGSVNHDTALYGAHD